MRLILLRLLLALASGYAHAQDRSHIVRAGDDLAAIALTYGVTPDDLQRANALASSTVPIGRRLVIPAAVPIARAEPVENQPPPALAVPTAAEEAIAEPTAEIDEEAAAETPAAESGPPARREVAGAFARAIALPAGANVRYNGRWTPPGESSAWVMDCSNTTRWLYHEARGLDLPRTASGQYEWLRARGRLWRVRPDARALRRRLEPGDLLFWEDTYQPVRRPPVTHVMLYLGTDARGRMMMAGSQGASGPDTYEFQPTKKMGGYRFFFFFRRDGKFVAYGRP